MILSQSRVARCVLCKQRGLSEAPDGNCGAGCGGALDCAVMPLLLNRALETGATAEWPIELSAAIQMLA